MNIINILKNKMYFLKGNLFMNIYPDDQNAIILKWFVWAQETISSADGGDKKECPQCLCSWHSR